MVLRKIKYVFAIIFIITLNNVIAQDNYEDFVYLKNGSVIHGLIIEQIPNQLIKIQTRDGNIFVYKIDEIEKMTREQNNAKKSNANFEIKDLKRSGFSNITEIYMSVGGTGQNSALSGIQTINGYQINSKLNVGVGIGIEQISQSSNAIGYIPLFADFRTYFLKNKLTPFFSTGLGYSFVINKNYPHYPSVQLGGGLLINPSLGGKFFISKNTALNISLGYRYQQTSFKEYNTMSIVSTNYYVIKIGVTF